jgi:peptidyl-prolyl cis-trans isomerase SurA
VPFEALASQFSDSSTASIGGDLGDVQSGQLDRRVEEALERMQPGQIGGPIEVDTGIYIVALHDRREIRPPRPEDDLVEMRRLFFAVPPGAPPEKVERVEELAKSIMGTLRNCNDVSTAARKLEPDGNPAIGPLKVGSLPPALQQLVQAIEINDPAGPIMLDDGMIVLMVCNRTPGQGDLPSREAVLDSLGQQRIDMRARRLLSDLRAAAFVDIRI